MARALIVGCGCRGRLLGARLLEDGWSVRGTSRRPEGLEAIGASGIEPAAADPVRLGTVLDHVGDVAVIAWLMGSAGGDAEVAAAVNGERLESLMIRLVDTPVRRFVYEGAGDAPVETLAMGRRIVEQAGTTWRIPIAVIDAHPLHSKDWLAEARAAVLGTLTANS